MTRSKFFALLADNLATHHGIRLRPKGKSYFAECRFDDSLSADEGNCQVWLKAGQANLKYSFYRYTKTDIEKARVRFAALVAKANPELARTLALCNPEQPSKNESVRYDYPDMVIRGDSIQLACIPELASKVAELHNLFAKIRPQMVRPDSATHEDHLKVIAEHSRHLPSETSPPIQDVSDENVFPEGREKFRLHRSKERNALLVEAAKKQYRSADPGMPCQICRFSFAEHYGELGLGYIEAHHLTPIAELDEETEVRIEDLAMVCANCHRMLHRKRPALGLNDLKKLLPRNR